VFTARDIGRGELVLSMFMLVFFIWIRLLLVRGLATRTCAADVTDVR
jgi:hypothetical protein